MKEFCKDGGPVVRECPDCIDRYIELAERYQAENAKLLAKVLDFRRVLGPYSTVEIALKAQKSVLLQKRVVETHLQDLVEAIDRNHHATKGGTRLDGHGPCEVCSIIERGAQKSKP